MENFLSTLSSSTTETNKKITTDRRNGKRAMTHGACEVALFGFTRKRNVPNRPLYLYKKALFIKPERSGLPALFPPVGRGAPLSKASLGSHSFQPL